jgi:hypothetical protein
MRRLLRPDGSLSGVWRDPPSIETLRRGGPREARRRLGDRSLSGPAGQSELLEAIATSLIDAPDPEDVEQAQFDRELRRDNELYLLPVFSDLDAVLTASDAVLIDIVRKVPESRIRVSTFPTVRER